MTKSVDYSQPSPFRENIIDYSVKNTGLSMHSFSNIVVFPNPVEEALHIPVTDISMESVKVEIVDIAGKIV